jgi:hypothetical protein
MDGSTPRRSLSKCAAYVVVARPGGQGQSLVAGEPAPERLVVNEAGRVDLHETTSSPDFFEPLEYARHPVSRQAPGVVDVPNGPGTGVGQDEHRCSLRVGRREEHGHRAALGVPEDCCPARTRGIHDRADVVHPLLQGVQRSQRHGVGDARPALVEAKEPAERRQAAKEARERRLLPHHLDIAGPRRDEH